MDIVNVKVNYNSCLIGMQLDELLVSWEIIGVKEHKVDVIEVKVSQELEFHTLMTKKQFKHSNQCQCKLSVPLTSYATYYVQVMVVHNGEYKNSKVHRIVLPKCDAWIAKMISPVQYDANRIIKQFTIDKAIKHAYLSICGLGLYEAYLNDQFVNEEFLMPGYHSYDTHIQFQTYDVAGRIKQGQNEMSVLLGNGWYKGRLGFDGGFDQLYGDRLSLIFELYVEYIDGTSTIIYSDEDCVCKQSYILDHGIYDGETIDMTRNCETLYPVEAISFDYSLLTPRYSPRITIKKKIKPIKYMVTPKGEHVLDFGQNLTGWIEVNTSSSFKITFGEVLQNNCFYNENYRTATFGFRYISDGKKRWVRPHFTYFGFRYAKIEKMDELHPDDFHACLITSEMEHTGYIETGHELVNQLLSNIKWSQMDNFLDVPTDCPQRDERLGWTGDAQIFSGTALFQMNAIPFFRKYLHDMLCEQELDHGAVPNVIPTPKPKIEHYMDQEHLEKGMQVIKMFQDKNMCPWADAATIIPWNLYLFSGDIGLLEKTYPNMKLWVDQAMQLARESGNEYLIDSGFHFADWLALDGSEGSAIGATDMHFVASMYYYHSTILLSKAAHELGYDEGEAYHKYAMNIKQAIREKYLRDGIVSVDTQTGYILAIHFQLLEEQELQLNIERLVEKLHQNNDHLDTGFVGTPYLNFVLSKHGFIKLAYDLLLNESYPSWLYEVKLGATTIWERWNSILADGSINQEGMNSLNHYAYGAIGEWIYREVCGLNQLEPGFKKALIAPKVDHRLGHCECSYHSVNGLYHIRWEFLEEHQLQMIVDIPFGCEAVFYMPITNEKMELQHGHYSFTTSSI